ncbi:hypothetical protein SARC_08462 [Sphaeroforma arctica JP610]|uniref:J domain-containing protein n=1 Tax=Sphaeroforma arctica JP610 TaxID=667725 RepID=A0A0L0FQU4_9EUKA|nr:hypothetical protein SARC_08462 [Sphaeroforma arctica JP610]KNC79135.1 hypothetical protein SARC_08462 [Sphaeroforma arctica JP610]|eukprot:XP_014153037.1 hypothetical protein SARC_08462 [Sphaeroforma arctica JP610]
MFNTLLKASKEQKSKEKNFYTVLNCVPTSSAEQITCEYRRLVLKLHPDKVNGGQGIHTTPSKVAQETEDHKGGEIGPYVELNKEDDRVIEGAELFIAVQEAYKTLKNDRHSYDKYLNSGLAISWKQWKVLESTKQATHWHNPTDTKPTLADSTPQAKAKDTQLTREEALKAFRAGKKI